MALRQVLLGMLTEDPASGYQLSQRFHRAPWRYVWHAQASQIYPELQEMAAIGLVTEVARGKRQRRTFAITRSGQAALQQWVPQVPDRFVVRNELGLRLLLIATIEPAEAQSLLEPIVAESARDLKRMRAAVSTGPEAALRSLTFERLAAEVSLRSVEALHRSARWALVELGRR